MKPGLPGKLADKFRFAVNSFSCGSISIRRSHTDLCRLTANEIKQVTLN